MSQRSIEYRRVRDLLPDERNPKAHDLSLIDASVDRFGYVEPIVEDRRTGKIISGHGRTTTLAIMEERGAELPDGVSLGEDGSWEVPVVVGWASANDEEARATLIALNRSTETGGWIDEGLLELLTELAGTDDGLRGVGFDEDDVERMLRLNEALGDSPDVMAEWTAAGLSDLDNEDQAGVYHVHVSFATMDDYVEFRRRLDLQMPPRTRLWFPEQPNLIESTTEQVAVDA